MTDDSKETQEASTSQPNKQTIQNFAIDVRDYVNFVNRIAEVIRLTDDVGNRVLDADLTVNDVLRSLVRRGEKINTEADKLYDFASRLDED